MNHLKIDRSSPFKPVTTDSSFLPPVREDDFLPPISKWTSLGGLFILGAVTLSLGIASVIQYKVTIQATATVRPAGELRLVQSATEGLVTHILAGENQTVKKGDVIALIDDSGLQTKKSQLQTNIRQGQLQLLGIEAQFRALESQMGAEIARSQRSVASAEAQLSLQQREHQEKAMTVRASIEEAEAHFRESLSELQRVEAELKSSEANLKSIEASAHVAGVKSERYTKLVSAGAISQEQLEETLLANEQQKQAVESQKATVRAGQKTIARQQQAVAAARARWQKAKAGINPTRAEIAIATQRIAGERAAGEVTLATLHKEREALGQEKIQTQQQLERDTKELQQITRDLTKSAITATADGTISSLQLRNPGQTVRPGEEIARIVPLNAPLEVKAEVSPGDIGKLAEGQKVHLRVSACPYPDYGTLKGVVRHISQDRLQSEDKTRFYRVTIQPQSRILGTGGKQCTIKPGMEGRADIISREETVLQFLLRKIRLSADL